MLPSLCKLRPGQVPRLSRDDPEALARIRRREPVVLFSTHIYIYMCIYIYIYREREREMFKSYMFDVNSFMNFQFRIVRFLFKMRWQVLTGAPFCSKAVGKWDLDYLAGQLDEELQWKVHVVPDALKRFQPVYGENLGKGTIKNMTFQESCTGFTIISTTYISTTH